jgi:hypothetical protein
VVEEGEEEEDDEGFGAEAFEDVAPDLYLRMV